MKADTGCFVTDTKSFDVSIVTYDCLHEFGLPDNFDDDVFYLKYNEEKERNLLRSTITPPSVECLRFTIVIDSTIDLYSVEQNGDEIYRGWDFPNRFMLDNSDLTLTGLWANTPEYNINKVKVKVLLEDLTRTNDFIQTEMSFIVEI